MAVLKQDLEVILDSIVTLIKNKLNTKLSAISSEKGGSVPLPAIDTSNDSFGLPNGISILTLNEKIFNVDPFIHLEITDIQSTSMPGITANKVSLAVLAVKADEGDNANIHRTMLRYMRALQEIFEENFDDLAVGSKYSIENLAPRTLGELDTVKTFRGSGVGITFQYN